MIEDRSFKREEVSGSGVLSDFRRSRLDLVVLRYMACKIGVTLHTLAQPLTATLPLSYAFEERRGRSHRMIIFAPQQLLTEVGLYFVGFVSKRSAMADKQTVAGIFTADQEMLREIARVPGLLSYSSLELQPGNWYNLVVFGDLAVKAHIRTLDIHRYAAHQLSPSYYEWIRLHNGTLPDGLAHLDFRLHSTKYYLFARTQQLFAVRECTYDGLYQRLT